MLGNKALLRLTLWGMAAMGVIAPAAAERILFVGNSFTFGAGSPVRTFHPELVRDLNRSGSGGVPALFKIFTEQAGLDWEVSLETAGGRDFAYHLANKKTELAGAWDVVVLQDYSTLDRQRPGDPTTHVRDAATLAGFFKAGNPAVRILLETTWPRADQTYTRGGHWHGRPIRAMAADLARANVLAMQASREISGVIPVGDAWVRAMDEGLADPDPYDGVSFGKVNLWTWDQYHASAYGYYLAALVIFGRVTGADPRSLGAHERAADELGLNPAAAQALQRVAAATLGMNGRGSGDRDRAKTASRLGFTARPNPNRPERTAFSPPG